MSSHPPIFSSSVPPLMFQALVLVLLLVLCSSAANFHRDFDITWGRDGRARILNNGELLSLSLDEISGSSIQSKNKYLFGKFDIQLKLVPGDSAGTVTSFYLSSQGSDHDEIDFEFLGNLSGEPYVLHTNVFTGGRGGREQQFYLWFDPTADFHTYSIIWTPNTVVLLVDETPIREFRNLESIGVPYVSKQPMRVYASIWNAEFWATRGGLVKTNWTQAPFTASYREFQANASIWSSRKSSCTSNSTSSSSSNIDEHYWLSDESDFLIEENLKWVHNNYMIYNYCTDLDKFPQGLPAECVTDSERQFSEDLIFI